MTPNPSPPSAADTLLVTAVAGRIERALAERWHLPAGGLHQSIDALQGLGLGRDVVPALHYLRMQRNRVLHHPRQALGDPARFRALAERVLTVLEGRPCALPEPPQPGGSTAAAAQPGASAWRRPAVAGTPGVSPLIQGLRAMVDARMQALLERTAAHGRAAAAAEQLAGQALARLRGVQARRGPSDRI